MARTQNFVFDTGNSFPRNCFPVRPLHQSTSDGAWIRAHRAEQKRRFKAAVCTLKSQQPNKVALSEGSPVDEKGSQKRLNTFKQGDEDEESVLGLDKGFQDVVWNKELKRKEGVLDGFYLMKHTGIDDPHNLASIDISGENLADIKPEDLQWFTSVMRLNAADNMLSLEPLSGFPALRELEIPLNGLCLLNLKPGDFPNLEYLDVSYNNLSSDSILNIGILPKLRHLQLSGNHLRHLPPDLSEPYIRDEDGEVFPRFSELQILMLDDNMLSQAQVFASLGTLKKLRVLNLERNEIQAVPILHSVLSSSSDLSDDDADTEAFHSSFATSSPINSNIIENTLTTQEDTEVAGQAVPHSRPSSTRRTNTPRRSSLEKRRNGTKSQISQQHSEELTGVMQVHGVEKQEHQDLNRRPNTSYAKLSSSALEDNSIVEKAEQKQRSRSAKVSFVNQTSEESMESKPLAAWENGEEETSQMEDPNDSLEKTTLSYSQENTMASNEEMQAEKAGEIAPQDHLVSASSIRTEVLNEKVDNIQRRIRDLNRRASVPIVQVVQPLPTKQHLHHYLFTENAPKQQSSLPPPFQALQSINLSHNQISQEEHVLAVMSWPHLIEIILHNNPLTRNRSGEPPLLQKFLVRQCGIKVVRSKPSTTISSPKLQFSQKKNRKVTCHIPKVPRCDVEKLLMAIEIPQSTKSFTQKSDLSTPLPPISTPKPSEVDPMDSIFMTQVPLGEDDAKFRETLFDNTLPPKTLEIADKPQSRTIGSTSLDLVPQNPYSILEAREDDYVLGTEEEKALVKDIQSNILMLQHLLNRPIHANERDILLDQRQPEFRTLTKKMNLQPKNRIPTRRERVRDVLDETKQRKTLAEEPLNEVLRKSHEKSAATSHKQKVTAASIIVSQKSNLSKKTEAETLLQQIQQKYNFVRSESMQLAKQQARSNLPQYVEDIRQQVLDSINTTNSANPPTKPTQKISDDS